MILYKIDILKELKRKGITQTTIRTQHLIHQTTVQKIRQHDYITLKELEKICRLLELTPNDIISFTDEKKEAENQ